MQGKYILCALIVISLVCSPAAATARKVANGAPVFIGESDLDISSAIKDCHVIAWWPDETNMSGPAAKNITIQQANEVILPVNHFDISPDLFGGYPGNWYCEDKHPTFVVLNVQEPDLSVRVWDLDNNRDVSGQAIPVTTNITYRIDTNLNQALDYSNRTDLTPADGFFTIALTTPLGKEMSNIYTGNVGSSTTQILIFDNNPFITTPVYYGRNLESWNRLARDERGDLLYPAGTYTFTVTQNLNNMQKAYPSTGAGANNGKTSSSATITFYKAEAPVSAVPSAVNTTVAPESGITVKATQQTSSPTMSITGVVTEVPVTTKTTYAPVPLWIVIGGICAGLLLVRNRD